MFWSILINFRPIFDQFYVKISSILGQNWVNLRSISGPFKVHFRSILGPLQVNFRSTLGQFQVIFNLRIKTIAQKQLDIATKPNSTIGQTRIASPEKSMWHFSTMINAHTQEKLSKKSLEKKLREYIQKSFFLHLQDCCWPILSLIVDASLAATVALHPFVLEQKKKILLQLLKKETALKK